MRRNRVIINSRSTSIANLAQISKQVSTNRELCVGAHEGGGSFARRRPREEAKQWLKQSIYRVPAHIKNSSSSSYGPQLVSLGPIHHGSHDLAPMEEQKKRALLHLLWSTGRPFRGLVASLAEVVPKLQDQGPGRQVDRRRGGRVPEGDAPGWMLPA
jgi:hypothetical protein